MGKYGKYNFKLSDIDIGNADGERESDNENFYDFFYNRHGNYESLKNDRNKFIVTGKKGSGKTYLVKYLEKKVINDGILAKTIKWNDINRDTLVELGKQTDEPENAIFYEYIIYIEIARLLLSIPKKQILKKIIHPIKFLKAIRSLHKLKAFYTERYPNGNYSIEKIKKNDSTSVKVDISSSLKGINNGNSTTKNVAVEKEFVKKTPYQIIEELEKLVFNILQNFSTIMISDDLDEQELNMLSNENFSSFLIKYIYAVNQINLRINKFNSKCIIVLRNDILDKLNSKSSNINKQITDSTIYINWCEKQIGKPWNYELAKMILNKIKISAKLDIKVSNKTLYKFLFPDNVEGVSAIDFLISRSLGRPRDIIVFLNKIKEKRPDSTNFKPAFFREVLNDYSNYFVNEFKNEMSIFFNQEEIEQIFSLLSDFNKRKFTFEDLQIFYNNNIKQYQKVEDLKSVVANLYSIGLLGNINDGAVSFAYRVDGKEKANFNADFVIHYGAQKKLVSNFHKSNYNKYRKMEQN